MTREEFDRTWLPLAPGFYKVAYYLLESEAEAKDAVQEVFVKLCMVICNVFYYGVFLAAAVGLFRMAGKTVLSSQLLLPLYSLGLTLAHMLGEGANRYHYSVIPMLIIIAALGFTRSEKT